MPLTRSLPKACTGNMSRATADATERDITKADAAADMVRDTAMVTAKAIATEKATTKADAAAIIKNSGHVASARIHIGRIARPL